MNLAATTGNGAREAQAARSYGLRTRPDGLVELEFSHTVTMGETSSVGFVYFSKLIDWQGQYRELFGIERIRNYMETLGGDTTMVTHSCSCQYFNEIWFADRVLVRITVPWVRMQFAQGVFEYYRATETGEVLAAKGEQVWMSARRQGNVFSPGPWPQEFLDATRELGADTSRALVA
ncbi:acyl-CoA thioesterase [Amycolatopsis sulphurea]|uniref:acyl-CoA thioesterase n=1 Tax=Amycolatopsis sulphurea TaxID=76022 RepID=UPI003681AA6C